jgi:hypothetical protein
MSLIWFFNIPTLGVGNKISERLPITMIAGTSAREYSTRFFHRTRREICKIPDRTDRAPVYRECEGQSRKGVIKNVPVGW